VPGTHSSIRPRAVVVAASILLAAGCDAGSQGSASDAGADVAAVFACEVPASPPSTGSCVTTSTSGVACNPVTNAPCVAGQACDITVDSTSEMVTGFTCYDGPNDATLCAPCSTTGGASCGGGLSCADVSATFLACARFCCTDADCGAGRCLTTDGQGRALFGAVASGLGLCAASAGDGGVSDGGDGG
jgi:hypothetical protein